MKILCILETAYRGTQEEQDDATLWLTHALQNAGSKMGILLRGNAVNYAVSEQNPIGLVIGKHPIEHPPFPQKDLTKMKEAGVAVHIVKEDVEKRGIATESLVQDFKLISSDALPALLSQYDQVWHW